MDLTLLVNELRGFSFEKEWFEFKENWLQPVQLGEYVFAISNSAAMLGRDYGYFVWGVSDDEGHELVGIDFDPDCEINHEPLKHYLARQLESSVDFEFLEGEAVVNAFVHNVWVDGNEPMVTVFSDRIEILSRGMLPPHQTMRGFFAGELIPVNRKLSEIFLQLHISEKTGRGVPKIVERCGRSSFEFRETSIVVTIPFTRVEKRSTKNEAAAAQYVPLTAKEVLCNHHDNLPINLLTYQSTC